MTDREDRKAKRQKILNRLNSYSGGLSEEELQREKELERRQRQEREMEIIRSKRATPGF